jgi:hypothetical protein
MRLGRQRPTRGAGLAEGHISAKPQNPPPAILRTQQQRCPVRRTPFLRTATSPDHRRTVRRLALVVGVSVLLVLGFGAAFVLAGGLSGKQSIDITICHSGSGNKFKEISPENVGVLLGHVKNDEDDIIPPFAAVNDKGEEIDSDGQNMDETYGGGHTGAEVLRNGCDVPEGSVVTRTETTGDPRR